MRHSTHRYSATLQVNVLMVVAWDNLGGVSAVVNNAALYLQEYGHTVHFLFPEHRTANSPGKTRLGFPAHYLYLRPTSIAGHQMRSRLSFTVGFPSTVVALRRLVRELRIDLVNVHFPGTWSIHFVALRKLGLAKLVTSIHGADVLLNGARDHVPHAAINMLFAGSDVVVTPSDGFQVAVRDVWPEAKFATMATIPNGIDPAELGCDVSAGETAVEPPYVMSILAMVPYKGPDILIRAFGEIAAQHPTLMLRLIGDGPNRAEYEALTASLGLSHCVEFLGQRDRQTVAQYLRGCTVFVLPSRSNSESFGIAVAEAMALNRAVIGSNVGGLPELIEHNVTGLLVPPGDVQQLGAAILQLLNRPDERTRLGNAAGVRIRQSRLWRNTGAMYLELFRRIVRG